jgi:hypothetical protein
MIPAFCSENSIKFADASNITDRTRNQLAYATSFFIRNGSLQNVLMKNGTEIYCFSNKFQCRFRLVMPGNASFQALCGKLGEYRCHKYKLIYMDNRKF